VGGRRWAPVSRPPRRVFISHTSERGERGFVAAARTAVIRAGDAMIDMAYFTAQGTDPVDYCARMVGIADVYVGIIGFRYGSPVRGRQALSFTELEFEIATSRGMPRLIFLLSEAPASSRRRSGLGVRQAAFRQRLQRTGLTTAQVTSPAELETRLYQALVELHLDELAAMAPRPDWPRSPARRATSSPADVGPRW